MLSARPGSLELIDFCPSEWHCMMQHSEPAIDLISKEGTKTRYNLTWVPKVCSLRGSGDRACHTTEYNDEL